MKGKARRSYSVDLCGKLGSYERSQRTPKQYKVVPKTVEEASLPRTALPINNEGVEESPVHLNRLRDLPGDPGWCKLLAIGQDR